MKIDQVITALTAIFSSSTRIPVLLLGPPGCGKGAAVAAASKLSGLEQRTFALPTMDEVDLRGLPHVVDGVTRWASPLPKTGRGVILLDELSSASRAVQVAAHHLLWDESGSDLGTSWHVVATGNGAGHRAVVVPITGPLQNRVVILSVEVDHQPWDGWAMNSAIHSSVVGFLRWRPELLMAREIPQEGPFPSPRSWERVSTLIPLTVSQDIERELIEGAVGRGASMEFGAYLRTVRELPDLEEILKNPESSPIPTSPGTCYAVVSALAQAARTPLKNGQKPAMLYVRRLPAEFGVVYLRDIRGTLDIRKDPVIREWVEQHQKLFRAEVENV